MMEKSYPDLIPYVSSCKSPQMMMGAMVKTYLSEKQGIPAKDICMVSVMPCVRKQGESPRHAGCVRPGWARIARAWNMCVRRGGGSRVCMRACLQQHVVVLGGPAGGRGACSSNPITPPHTILTHMLHAHPPVFGPPCPEGTNQWRHFMLIVATAIYSCFT